MTQPYAKGRFTMEVDSGNGYEVVLEKDNLFTNVMAQQYDLYTLGSKQGGWDANAMLAPAALEIANDDNTASASLSYRQLDALATAPLFSASVGVSEKWKGSILRDMCTIEVKPDGFLEQKFVCEFGNGIGTGSINKLRVIGKTHAFINRFADMDNTTKWNSFELPHTSPFNGFNQEQHISGRLNSLEPANWRDAELDTDGDNYLTYINCMASSESYRLIPSGLKGQGDNPTIAVSPIIKNVLPNIFIPGWASRKDISEFKTVKLPAPNSKTNQQTRGRSDGRVCSVTVDDSGIVYFAQQEGSNAVIYKYVIGSSGEYESTIFATIAIDHSPTSNHTFALTSNRSVLYLTYITTDKLKVVMHVINASTGAVDEVKTATMADSIETSIAYTKYVLNDSYFDDDLDAIMCVFKKAYYYSSKTLEYNSISMVGYPMNHNEPMLLGVCSDDYATNGLDSLVNLYVGNHPQWAWGLGSSFGYPSLAGTTWDTNTSYGSKAAYLPTFVATNRSLVLWRDGSGMYVPFKGSMHGVIAETNIPAFDKTADVSVKVTYVLTSRGEFESCS